jgi:CRISPR-associated protein Csx17
MTLPEVRALFHRGRTEVRGRGANTPAAFAAAILQRGVDAGIARFVRFALGGTTSRETFEPRYQGMIRVQESSTQQRAPSVPSKTVGRILELFERLPRDTEEGQRRQFFGLRGPIEAGLVGVAQSPEDPDQLRGLLDAVVSVLDRIDRNVSHRGREVRWQPLPLDDLPSLFGNTRPPREARLAIALVSAFPPDRPFAIYRFGVKQESRNFVHPASPPARWVYGPGPLPRVLAEVLVRSLLDWQQAQKDKKCQALRPDPITVPATDVQHWLDGLVDEALLDRWLGRLALFDWRRIVPSLRSLVVSTISADSSADLRSAGASLLLAGLLGPLFDGRPLCLESARKRGDVLAEQTGARTPGAARAMAALIRAGSIDSALRIASSRYAMASVPLMHAQVPWKTADPERLLAALLFPIDDRDRRALVARWLRPQRVTRE